MTIKTHIINQINIAEVVAESVLIQTPDDALDLLANLYYQGFDSIIINQLHITPLFFELSNGMAGEILQKFSNYRVRLVVTGEFENVTSKSLKDFVYESNKGRHINFLGTTADALQALSK
ncbi:DUF4180 domain-containing protein [Mucilaginibacter hurinus]|nr:DUF4180 domain-containing protein [Mucilaginibacter hurinus]